MESKIKKLQGLYWSTADPDGTAFVCLADAYRKVGDAREALRILRDGLQRHPGLSSGHVVRGWIHAERGDAPEAEAAFRAALAVDSRNIAALRGLGDMLALRGELTEALEVFRALLPLDPLDEELPRRIAGVEAALEVGPSEVEAGLPDSAAETTQPPWDDPEGVAEELDWAAAALQTDQSRAWESGPRAGGPGARPGHPHPEEGAPHRGPLLDDALITRTMGEIFARQGLLDQAEEVFRRLTAREPENLELRHRLDELRALREGTSLQPEEQGETTAESRDPDTSGDILPIQALLADPVLGTEELAPNRILSIDDLAPDPALSVEELEPDPVLPVASLAPELVVPMDELAPDAIVRIETLAPDSSPEDPVLDAFEAWLDKLQ